MLEINKESRERYLRSRRNCCIIYGVSLDIYEIIVATQENEGGYLNGYFKEI